MKSVLIIFEQAYYEQVMSVLSGNNVRGFTLWDEVKGKGSKTGEPHLGSHAWPTLNSTMLTVVEDEKVDNLLKDLRELDLSSEMMGLRAFVWSVEKSI